MPQLRYMLRKARHLCLRRDIDDLFTSRSQGAVAFPVRAVWLVRRSEDQAPFRLMVIAPKRKLRHAVDRNRAKRLMREAFRLNQHRLSVPPRTSLHLALLWVAPTTYPWEKVHKAVALLLQRISHSLSQRTSPADENAS